MLGFLIIAFSFYILRSSEAEQLTSKPKSMFRFSQKPRYVSESLHNVMLKIETRAKLTEYNIKLVYSTVFTD